MLKNGAVNNYVTIAIKGLSFPKNIEAIMYYHWGVDKMMNLDELVNAHFEQLKQNDLYIWNYISNHKKQCCDLTIDELASKCNVSRTTILRFAQRLSLKGYSELKIYLKWETRREPINNNLIDNFCNLLTRSIADYRKYDFSRICELIYRSKKVFLYGTGTVQRSVAQEMRRIFLIGNEHFYVIEGVDEISALINTLTNEDLVIMISLKGESDNAKVFSKQLVLKGIPFVTITRREENELSHLSTESIYINTPEVHLNANIGFQVLDSYFILVDLLFFNYILYKENQDQEAE